MPKLNKKEMIDWLHSSNKGLYDNLAYRTIKILQAIYGTKSTTEIIRTIGCNIFKSSWIDDFTAKRHYGYPLAEHLMRSQYHMQKMQNKYISRINSYSLDTIREGQLIGEARHISFYTVLASGADDKPSRDAHWLDLRNHKTSQHQLDKFHAKLTHQISSNRRFRHAVFLAGDSECPWHFTQQLGIYAHGHNHALIGITKNDESVVRQLNATIKQDWQSIFGYQLILPKRKHQHLEPIQPLTYSLGRGQHQQTYQAVLSTNARHRSNSSSLNAVDSFVHYLLTDYHIQTKDCNFAQFMKLPMQARHIIVCTQLRSTYRDRIQRCISKTKAEQLGIRLFMLYAMLDNIAQSLTSSNGQQSLFSASDYQALPQNYVTGKHWTYTEQWSRATKHQKAQKLILSTEILPYMIKAILAMLQHQPRPVPPLVRVISSHEMEKQLTMASMMTVDAEDEALILGKDSIHNKKSVLIVNTYGQNVRGQFNTYIHKLLPTTTDRMRASGIPP